MIGAQKHDAPAQRPDLSLAGDEPTIRALLLQRADAAPLRGSGVLAVTGDEGTWSRVRDAFGLVESAS